MERDLKVLGTCPRVSLGKGVDQIGRILDELNKKTVINLRC